MAKFGRSYTRNMATWRVT